MSKNIADNLKMTKKIIGMVQSICPSFLPLTLLEKFLAVAGRFLNILLGAAIIDGIAEGRSESRLLYLAFILVLANMVIGLVTWAVNKLLIIKRRRIEESVDARIAEKALTMDYQVFEKTETLDYIEQVREGVRVHGGTGSYCYMAGRVTEYLITIVYSIILLLPMFNGKGEGFINSPLAVVLMAMLMLLVVFCNGCLFKKMNINRKKAFEIMVRGNRELTSFVMYMHDYRDGKAVRIYSMQKLILDKYSRLSEYLLKTTKAQEQKEAFLELLGQSVFMGFMLCAYLFVGLKVMAGTVTIGELSLYVGALLQLRSAVTGLLGEYVDVQVRNGYMSNYLRFLELKNEKYDGTLPIEKRLDNDYELEFRNVSFHYPSSSEPVLKNITTKLRVGKKMAIVGKNGSGKSTFIKLLCRLYDPTEGSILLNGIDIRKYDYNEYRDIFGVVFQDFRLYSFPMAQNVAAGVEYDEEKVKHCLYQAGLKERVENMEKGIETVLYQQGDEGVEISGGEAQKIAIARALYKDAPVVILDEPTAALDPVSELEIYEKFDELVEEKTAIYISHRMSSCRFCENILVFDDGNIVQKGSHETLLREEGLYRELWEAQAKYYA